MLVASIALSTAPALANHVQDHYENYPERLGDVQKDGTVYAGRLQLQEYQEMYVSPGAGFRNHVSFDEGREYCAALQDSGHSDWRMADGYEMWQIFYNRRVNEKLHKATGNFNAASYWVAERESHYPSGKTQIVKPDTLLNAYVPGDTPNISVVCVRP
jgi:hypothetical protein